MPSVLQFSVPDTFQSSSRWTSFTMSLRFWVSIICSRHRILCKYIYWLLSCLVFIVRSCGYGFYALFYSYDVSIFEFYSSWFYCRVVPFAFLLFTGLGISGLSHTTALPYLLPDKRRCAILLRSPSGTSPTAPRFIPTSAACHFRYVTDLVRFLAQRK